MAEVSFRSINQCTLEDPTDGAEPSHAPPPPAPNPQRSCDSVEPGAGGRGGDDCTDALVHRFSSEGGAPVIVDGPPASCLDAGLKALQTCSPLLLAGTGTPKAFTAAQAIACADTVVSLVECLTRGDVVR